MEYGAIYNPDDWFEADIKWLRCTKKIEFIGGVHFKDNKIQIETFQETQINV